jgi:hypothetical protein
LRRLVEAPDVRNELGLDLVKKQLYSTVPAEEVIKGLRRVVLDLAEKKYKVTQLKSKAQMVAYVLGLDKKHRPDLKKSIDPTPLDELTPSPVVPRVGGGTGGGPTSPGPIPPSRGPGSSSTPPRSLPSPPRIVVVARPFRLRVSNAKAGEIYEELKSLLLAKHKHAISVLLRVFLEISIDHHLQSIGSKTTYYDAKNGREVEKKLKAKVEESVDHFIAQGASKREFEPVLRAVTTKGSPLNPELLNSYVHNRFSTPLQGDLTATWDNALPLLGRIWA